MELVFSIAIAGILGIISLIVVGLSYGIYSITKSKLRGNHVDPFEFFILAGVMIVTLTFGALVMAVVLKASTGVAS